MSERLNAGDDWMKALEFFPMTGVEVDASANCYSFLTIGAGTTPLYRSQSATYLASRNCSDDPRVVMTQNAILVERLVRKTVKPVTISTLTTSIAP